MADNNNEIPVDELISVNEIAFEFGIPVETARRWSDAGRSNGFPEVAERLGKLKFYHRQEVLRWLALKEKAQKQDNRHRKA